MATKKNVKKAASKRTRKAPTPKERWLGWHLLAEDRKLKYNDNRVAFAGATLTVEPKGWYNRPRACEYGLHASQKIVHARPHCTEDKGWLCRVELVGERDDRETKSAAFERRVLWMVPSGKVFWATMFNVVDLIIAKMPKKSIPAVFKTFVNELRHVTLEENYGVDALNKAHEKLNNVGLQSNHYCIHALVTDMRYAWLNQAAMSNFENFLYRARACGVGYGCDSEFSDRRIEELLVANAVKLHDALK